MKLIRSTKSVATPEKPKSTDRPTDCTDSLTWMTENLADRKDKPGCVLQLLRLWCFCAESFWKSCAALLVNRNLDAFPRVTAELNDRRFQCTTGVGERCRTSTEGASGTITFRDEKD